MKEARSILAQSQRAVQLAQAASRGARPKIVPRLTQPSDLTEPLPAHYPGVSYQRHFEKTTNRRCQEEHPAMAAESIRLRCWLDSSQRGIRPDLILMADPGSEKTPTYQFSGQRPN